MNDSTTFSTRKGATPTQTWLPFSLLLAAGAVAPIQANETIAIQPSAEAEYRFRIPPQDLTSALNAFAETAQVQISFPSELAAGKTSPGVEGRYEPEQALEKLIKGSGLTYRITPNGSITLQPVQTQSLTTDRLLAASPMEKFMYAAAEPEEEPYTGPVEQVEMTVRGGDWSGYTVLDATTATKTDTPIMDTPVSIQVVPEAVMRDQQAIRLDDITRNVSGVQAMRQLGVLFDNFVIRGFNNRFNVYRDGLRLKNQSFETANLDRLEVVKGPPSALYGRSEPGGLINMVTKKPLFESYYSVGQQFGSYDLYRTTLDATGPITDDKTLAYRLNFVYLDSNSFRDFVERERVFVAPQFTWRPTEKIKVNFGYEYSNDDITGDRGIPAIGNRPADVPISRFLGEPDFSLQEAESHLAHLTWLYEINENWKIQQRFAAQFLDTFNRNIIPISLQADNRTVNRGLFSGLTQRDTYAQDININGKLDLLGTKHDVLIGFDYLRFETGMRGGTFLASAPFITSIDIFNPIYGTVNIPADLPQNNNFDFIEEWYGLYFQDQIDFFDSWHFLFSGRHDWVRTSNGFSPTSAPELTSVSTQKFSPRIGLLYQPVNWLSLYAHWSESLGVGNSGVSADGSTFKPEIAEEYEAGIKLELLDGRLNGSIAIFELTKENILTSDPASFGQFLIAVGKARSQGLEFDMSGQITDQWNVIGNYAYTNTKILVDNNGNQGNSLPNAPKHSGSLWTTYEIFEGLKLGTGIFLASQRQANIQNNWQLPGYVRWDAMAAYLWKVGDSKITAQINVNNILDKRYFAFADVGGNPRFDAMPGEPLTVLGSLRLEY